MAMVYNRSCTTEFAGLRYATRLDGGPLQFDALLKAGEANYVLTFGGARNRWGDYSGIAVDPADPRSVWMFGEYAASPTDTWGTWFGQLKFPGITSPSLVSPPDNALLNTRPPFFDWDESTGDVFDYLLEVTSGDISNGPFDIRVVIRHPTTEFQSTGDLPDGTYRWRVIARDAFLNAASSATRTLTVDTTPPGPPPLVFPEDDALLGIGPPSFDWEESTGDVFDYLLEVTSGDFSTGPFDIRVVTLHPTTEFQNIADLAGATYKWRVIARDAFLNTASSVTRTFAVDTTPPGRPELVVPEDGALFDFKTPLFDWDPATGDVLNYLLQVTSGDIAVRPFYIEVVITGDTTQFQAIGDLADATYKWRVKSRDLALNTTPSVTRTFTVDTTPPGPPDLVAPGEGTVLRTGTPSYDWTAAAGGVFDYVLQVTSADINVGPFDVNAVILHPTTDFQSTEDLPDATYKWHDIARDAALNTASSQTQTFTVDKTPPAAPTIISPQDKTDGIAVQHTFQWTGLARASSYTLEVASGDFDEATLFLKETVPHVGPADAIQSRTLSLAPATFYRWRVVAETSTGLTGEGSSPATFITAGNPVDITLRVSLQGTGEVFGPVDFNVRLYPASSFGPHIADTPWLLLVNNTPIHGLTGDATQTISPSRTFSIVINGLAPAFYDLTIGADHTLVNLSDDVGVARNRSNIDMGTLLEGNAVDDGRLFEKAGGLAPVEPVSIINALDAGRLAAAIHEQRYDPQVDFNRDGRVDPREGVQPDLELLKANDLKLSPVVVP